MLAFANEGIRRWAPGSDAHVKNTALQLDETGAKYTYAMRNYDINVGGSSGWPSNRYTTVSAECKNFEMTNITYTRNETLGRCLLSRLFI
jgi:hypothetical protein